MNDLNSIWLKQLTLQNMLTLDKNQKELESIIDLNNFKNILEVGCSFGSMISNLADQYPHISFTGIDINQNFINMAKINSNGNLSFECSDIYQIAQTKFEKNFDCVIFRLIIQHLSDYQKLLLILKKICIKGATIIIVDSIDLFDNYQKPITNFSNLIKKMRQIQNNNGNSSKRFLDFLCKKKFIKHRVQDISLKFSSKKENRLVGKLLSNSCVLIENQYKINWNYDQILKELENFSNYKNATSYLGMSLLKFTL